MARVHTIYGLYDPSDAKKEIRYVGATQFSPEQRLADHVWNAQRRYAPPEVDPEASQEFSHSSIPRAREKFWIKELRAQGHRLTTEGRRRSYQSEQGCPLQDL